MRAALTHCARHTFAASASSSQPRAFARVPGAPTLRHLQQRSAAAAEVVTSTSTPMAPPKNEDVKEMGGEMLQKSVFNTPLVRSAAILGTVAVAAGSTLFLPGTWAKFLHVASYGVWLGTNIYTTFVVGLTLFKIVPRQTFGRIQSKLFPIYFNVTTGTNALVLATLLLSKEPAVQASTAAVTLGVTLLANLANQFVIEPQATKLMFARYDLENKEDKTDADKAEIAKLYKAFGKSHGISSLLNLLVTLGAVSHGVFLAGRLAL